MVSRQKSDRELNADRRRRKPKPSPGNGFGSPQQRRIALMFMEKPPLTVILAACDPGSDPDRGQVQVGVMDAGRVRGAPVRCDRCPCLEAAAEPVR
jgi:hypothetical protein